MRHLATSEFTLCGRRGTYGTGLALVARLIPVVAAAVCVADVACGRIHFVWHAWHSVTSAFTLCGRCGTCGTGLALVARFVPVVAAAVCVADVAFGSIDLHSVWQAWHLATLTFTLCGRRPAYGTGLALVARFVPIVAAPVFVAGVAFGSIHLHSVWHTWHSVTSTFILCGRVPFRPHRARAPVTTWQVVALMRVRKSNPLPAADTCDGPSVFMTVRAAVCRR